ncbi:hypothetical protein GEMRC1_000951 [Eukaryota sp. GEM-RC1]
MQRDKRFVREKITSGWSCEFHLKCIFYNILTQFSHSHVLCYFSSFYNSHCPLSAWNSWAELFLKDATVQANTAPNQLAHLFRRVDLPIDDETDGFEMDFMVEELARRLETVERKRRNGVEDLIEDLPDIMRTSRKGQLRRLQCVML